MKSFIAFALLAGAAWAADPVPLDIKTGQWEATVTSQMTGLPQAAKQTPTIPPEVLKNLPPEQRAKVEEGLKQAAAIASGKPTSTTSRNCIKKEDLAKLNPNNSKDQSCKMTLVSSSRTKQEMKMDCDTAGHKSTGTVTIEALNSETIKFNLQIASDQNGTPINMVINGNSKWLGATCTETK